MRPVTVIAGVAEKTIHLVCTDVAQSFSNDQLLNSSGSLPIACLITVEGNDIRYAHNTTPVSGAEGDVNALGHSLYLRSSYLISNSRNIQNFQFINHTAGNNADIMATMFYEIGG